MAKNKLLATKVTLNNGKEIPVIGFGTYKIENNDAGKQAIIDALHLGYRHIDTAKIYDNEVIVGQAIKESKIPRDEIFVTTKLWGDDLTKEQYLAEIDLSLSKLGLDAVDLILIHWPWKNRSVAWQALEEAFKLKKVHSLGVSNYTVEQLEELKTVANILPVANQIEFHPGLNQEELRKYHQDNDIATIGWGTIRYHQDLPSDFSLLETKYSKSVQQLFLRWAYQHQSLIIPKSIHKDRMMQNADIADFIISDEDMLMIDSLPQMRMGPDPLDFHFG